MTTSRRKCIGYTALCVVALLGFATILVMVLIPDVRANLSFRPAVCDVLTSGIQYLNETEIYQRAYLDVNYVRDDGSEVAGVAYPDLSSTWTTDNQTQFITTYPVNGNFSCYYDPTNASHVVMTLQYRALTISMVAIAGAFMLLIPMLVCISTYVQGSRADSYAPIKFEPVQ